MSRSETSLLKFNTVFLMGLLNPDADLDLLDKIRKRTWTQEWINFGPGPELNPYQIKSGPGIGLEMNKIGHGPGSNKIKPGPGPNINKTVVKPRLQCSLIKSGPMNPRLEPKRKRKRPYQIGF